jgi:ankyrin repeat protein
MTESSEDYIWNIKNGDLESISKYINAVIDQIKHYFELNHLTLINSFLFLIKNPKSVNELIKGRTYLHYACDYGQKDIIEYLLSKGANINVI